jgi:acetyl esterase/lipase
VSCRWRAVCRESSQFSRKMASTESADVLSWTQASGKQTGEQITVLANSKMRRFTRWLMGLFFVCGLAQANAEVKVMEPTVQTSADTSAGSPDVRVERDVAYLATGRKEMADLYFPSEIAKGQRLPAVIIIHGGGFNDGDKGKSREINIGTNLARHGYIGMSINYKLRKDKGQVTWPQNLFDCKTAVRWLRKNAEQLQVDPDRIGVIGCSAGGNLAGMLALTRPQDGLDPKEPYAEFSTQVSCAVDFYGVMDLMNYHDVKMLNQTREEAPDLYRRASPSSYVHKDTPPILIVHGMADKTVATSQSESFAEALKKAGTTYQLVIIPDAEHSFNLEPPQRDLRPLVLGFFDQYLKGVNPQQPTENTK